MSLSRVSISPRVLDLPVAFSLPWGQELYKIQCLTLPVESIRPCPKCDSLGGLTFRVGPLVQVAQRALPGR